MKKSLLIAGLLCAALPLAFGQSLDAPAASVRLTRPQIITRGLLDKQVAAWEAGVQRAATVDERKSVLDALITRALIEQAAERDKVSVLDADVKARIALYSKSVSTRANLGRDMTEEELQSYVTSRGTQWSDFLDQVRFESLNVKYIQAKKLSDLAAVVAPTSDEAEDYYNYHKKDFVSDDMIELKHIFIDIRPIPAKEDRDKAAARAADIYRELKAGGKFDDLALKYSEDASSKYKAGNIGILDRLDAQRQQLFGKPFFDAVFKLKKGETSGVLQSNIGFHIVQVQNRYDSALLGLDDKIPPGFQVTTRQFILQNLLGQRQNEAFLKAQSEVIADLKKQAEIKTY